MKICGLLRTQNIRSLDLSDTAPRSLTSEGQQAADHFEAASPLLFKQRRLLTILNEERRRRHNELRNKIASGVSFNPGDLVIVRKQVKSVASRNFSAKLVFKTRGPYRVLEQVNPNSYKLQKLPFLRGLGRRGRVVKESAARMTKIPSTLIFHKIADGTDTRFNMLSGALAENALERWLGVINRGAYKQAADDATWAFEPLASMWSDELPPEDDSSEEENDEGEDEDELAPVDADSESEEEGQALPRPTPTPRADPSQLSLPSDTDKKALRKLHKAIQDSNDKLVLVVVRLAPDAPVQFRLGQVVLEDQSPEMNLQFGVYCLRWWQQHLNDKETRSLADSRFWPDIWTAMTDGRYGHEQPVRPDRATKTIQNDPTLIWKHGDVSLAEDLLVGPFDFTKVRISMQGPKRRAVSEDHRIDETFWNLLEARAPKFNLDVSDLRTVPQVPRDTQAARDALDE